MMTCLFSHLESVPTYNRIFRIILKRLENLKRNIRLSSQHETNKMQIQSDKENLQILPAVTLIQIKIN